ncbi:MAG: 2-C-methyl-D-erythritol 2,4-cyclodiphosphate synthase [Gammaproteobacteria bacterium]|nr:2-C-methyl-D-erythritol 2,4-cyclodiphosphate synthase [Pseudomonadales bacterium]MCP5346401.1 2-C-methyl-D-erythritol 2,4-cyclodiphosphate synthase [Pseudomonadales bacterium]
MKLRIGHGFDVHRFADAPVSGCELTLGGVRVPHDRPLLAHSDGDVIVHALCDAILGALGAGDIGHHFPDHDPRFKDADSCELLQSVLDRARSGYWKVVNADLTVVAQAPRLAPYVPAMRDRLAGLLEVDQGCLNIKATTTEGLGFAGRREGLAAHAVVLLSASDAA